MVENPTFLAAFAAGVLSFISPCVLPLIPGYLSYISGLTLDEMQGTGEARCRSARRGVACSSPRSSSSSASRSSSSASARPRAWLGQYMLERQRLLAKIAAVIVIVFGLHTMGVLRIGWLYSEKRVQVEKKPTSLFGAFFVGLAFAFGWTPCIGPILAGILAIAGTQQTVGQGVQLLAVYSAGLGLPFLLTAFAINQFFTVFKRIRKHYHLIEIISGLLLVLIGLLIFTNRFTLIAKWLTPYLPTF
jgi:cytochrome c-type biogenesis protein